MEDPASEGYLLVARIKRHQVETNAESIIYLNEMNPNTNVLQHGATVIDALSLSTNKARGNRMTTCIL